MKMIAAMDPDTFEKKMQGMGGQAYRAYQNILDLRVTYPAYTLHFKHIQGSPGASPASLCCLDIGAEYLQIPEWATSSSARTVAAEDYLLRLFNEGVTRYAKQNWGAGGSGSFQLVRMPQQVLKRNVVRCSSKGVSIAFRCSLPGSLTKKVLAAESLQMFNVELPAILLFVKERIAEWQGLKAHCDCVEDMLVLQSMLQDEGLIAFIGDGSLLPRESGVSDLPARFEVIPFKAPETLAVVVELPNGGRLRGMGIRPGITTLVGGGYHGKSTILNALAKAVYPHIPGDGRERVVANGNSVLVCAEDGRSIKGLDISPFINDLPQGSDAERFSTENASGSTSEAAAVVESVLAGAELLFIDEDTSATNFLIRDRHMRQLIPEDPITPLVDRVRELYEKCGVSTLIIAGSSSGYLGVAHQVIAMRAYTPVDMNAQVRALDLPPVSVPLSGAAAALSIVDNRVMSPENFNPAYTNDRLEKAIPTRIKPLRGKEHEVIEYGADQIDVRCLTGIVDPAQIYTIGYCLLLARRLKLSADGCSPTALARKLVRILDEKGLEVLQGQSSPPVFFAQTRLLEIAGAINRVRSLQLL